MILVTGATGNNGGEIVKQLLAAGVSVRALVRNRQKATSSLNSRVEFVEGDLAQLNTLDHALAGVEKTFLLTSADPQQVQRQGNFIEAAKRAGVKHIVKFSMLGADLNSPFVLAQWHRQTEAQLEASGLAWTHLRPNDLMQNMRRFIESIQTQGTISLPLQDGRVSMVDLRDVAAVAVKALTESSHENKIYTITGSEALSYIDVADKLSAAMKQPIRYVDLSPNEFKQALLQAEMPEAIADMMNTMYALESKGHNAEVTNTVFEVTGKKAIAFDQFAEEFAVTLMSRSAA